MKKVILCVAIAIVSVSCIKSDTQLEIEILEKERAALELRLSQLEYIKTLVFLKNSEVGTPAEKFVDSLLNQERKFLIQE